MIRVHLICEGQSEERFTNEVLSPYFLSKNIQLVPSLIGKVGHKGGNVKFERLFIDIRNRLKNEPKAYCTTFFDFYALPNDFPGKADADKAQNIQDKSNQLCKAFSEKLKADIGDNFTWRFIPYVQMYEYEALLFSDPEKFARGIFQEALAPEFQKIRQAFASPEEINDSLHTAPSKRILKLVAAYDKPVYGVLAALEIGLETIRKECHLFDVWLSQIENLKQES